uniref:Globin family profile domain-containing protein n=1 Tax=Scleropages formosus TaxID=113540 RepID=A0A8C9RNJ0_SCLFO
MLRYIGIGGEVLTKLNTQKLFLKFAHTPPCELDANTAVEQHGAVVLRKVGELLKAEETGLHNFKLVTVNDRVQLLATKAGLDTDGQSALRNVVDVVIADADRFYEFGFQGGTSAE